MAGRSTAKPVDWVGSAKDDLSAFPREAKVQLGHWLNEIANGIEPDSESAVKRMTDVGPGVRELRSHTGAEGRDHRAFFIAKFPEAVYVLHAFEKKQQKTPQREIETGRKRLKELIAYRKANVVTSQKKGRK
jgi:phage-related protein